MSRGSHSEHDGRRDEERPTLPSIRHIFRDELSHSPVALSRPGDSPPFSLSRLTVTDDENVSLQVGDPRYSSYLMGPGSRSVSSESNHAAQAPRRPVSTHPAFMRGGPELANAGPGSPSLDMYNQGRRRDGSSNAFYQFPDQAMAYPVGHRSSDPGAVEAMHSQRQAPSHLEGSSHRYSDAHSATPAPYNEPQGSRTEWYGPENTANIPVASKYECNYCGKGFNRPSSLKIHLNSHTGEKPFVCPVEGCGRSFSVLSNMRRHARVHAPQSHGNLESSSEDGSDPPAASGPTDSPVLSHSQVPSSATASSSSASYPSQRHLSGSR